MKKIVFLLTLAFLAFAISDSAFAKKPVFKVLALKGDVKVNTGGSWKKLSSNAGLFKNDKIKLADEAYLGLVHSSGRTLELQEKGKYSISDLSKKISKKRGNLSKRLTDFVFDEMSKADDLMASDDYHNSMNITGSVERGLSTDVIVAYDESVDPADEREISDFSDKMLIVKSPRKTNLLNTIVTLSWHGMPGVKDYRINLRDRFDREILSKNISDSSVTINLYDYNLEKDVYYFWNISMAENEKVKSADCAFRLLINDKVEQINKDLKELKSEYGDTPSVIGNIVIASFYEQNDLYLEALKSYQDAIKQVPGVEEYRKIYDVFLYRMRTGN